MKRDIILLSRELSVAIQSLIMLAFCLLFPLLSGGPSSELWAGQPFSLLSAAFFATFFGGQFGSRMIPLERMGFWLNLVTPDGRRLSLISKVIVGAIIVTLLVTIIGIVHTIAGVSHGISYIFYLIAFGLAGFASGIFFGAFFSNFQWEHPQRMLKSGWIFVYSISIIIVAGFLIGVGYLATAISPYSITPLIAVMFFSLVFLMLATIFSAMRLANMEWHPDV
jgi:hypothetical protein